MIVSCMGLPRVGSFARRMALVQGVSQVVIASQVRRGGGALVVLLLFFFCNVFFFKIKWRLLSPTRKKQHFFFGWGFWVFSWFFLTLGECLSLWPFLFMVFFRLLKGPGKSTLALWEGKLWRLLSSAYIISYKEVFVERLGFSHWCFYLFVDYIYNFVACKSAVFFCRNYMHRSC